MKLKINVKRFTLFVLLCLTLYVGILHYKTILDGINIKSESNKFTALLQEEQSKNELLKKRQENLSSDETIEQIARENLGLLKEGEIIFMDAEKK